MRYMIYYKEDLEELTCRLEVQLWLNVQQMSGKYMSLVLPSETSVVLRLGRNALREIKRQSRAIILNRLGVHHTLYAPIHNREPQSFLAL